MREALPEPTGFATCDHDVMRIGHNRGSDGALPGKPRCNP